MTALRDRRAARDAALFAKGDIVRIVDGGSWYVGMTGRVHFAGRAQCIVVLTSTGQSRALRVGQLELVKRAGSVPA